MKKLAYFMLCVAITLMVSCSGGKSGDNKTSKDSTKTETVSNETKSESGKGKYEMKSGIVYYDMEAMGMKMQMVLFFDEYGKKEATETIIDMSMMGVSVKTRDITINKEGYSYKYKIEENSSKKTEPAKVVYKTKMMINASDASQLSEEMKKRYDYKEEGTEEIAGVSGKKFTLAMNVSKKDERVTGVMYKNVMLKSEIKGVKIVASKFEKDVDVPASKFEWPSDYKVVEQ